MGSNLSEEKASENFLSYQNLFQFILVILGNIPESISPIQYSHLIPFNTASSSLMPSTTSHVTSSAARDWSDYEFARKSLTKDPAVDDEVSRLQFCFVRLWQKISLKGLGQFVSGCTGPGYSSLLDFHTQRCAKLVIVYTFEAIFCSIPAYCAMVHLFEGTLLIN